MAYYENLTNARENLQDQVSKGWIQQWQADAEYNRLKQENLQKAKQNLQDQVKYGGLPQEMADAEFNRLSGLDNAAFEQATSVDPAATGSDIKPQQPEQTYRNPNQYATDPATGRPISPITGTHQAEWGGPIAPAANFDTSANAVSTQEQYNRYNLEQQQLMNRPNEETDYGSLTYTRDPVTGQMTRTTKLSEPQQQILGQQQGRDIQMGEMAAGSLGQFGTKGAFSYADAPKIQGSEDMAAERRRQEDLYYQNWQNRNESQFAQEKEALQQSFADRGIPLTSERAQMEMKQLDQRHNDARLSAQNNAVSSSRDEYTTNFDVQKQNRQQYIDEYGQERYAPLNEMGTLLGYQKGITDPNVSNMSQLNVPLTDATGIGTTWRGQDINQAIEDAQRENERWLGQLSADTAIKTANIGAEASKYGYKLGLEGKKLENPPDPLGAKIEINVGDDGVEDYGRIMQKNAQQAKNKYLSSGTFGTQGSGYFGV